MSTILNHLNVLHIANSLLTVVIIVTLIITIAFCVDIVIVIDLSTLSLLDIEFMLRVSHPQDHRRCNIQITAIIANRVPSLCFVFFAFFLYSFAILILYSPQPR